MRDRRPSDLSEHLVLELVLAHHCGHTPRLMLRSEVLCEYLHDLDPAERRETLDALMSDPPLGPGEPAPGCSCPWCTGIPAGHPARQTTPRRWSSRDAGRQKGWTEQVERARAVPVAELARRLGCGPPLKQGREVHVRCPLHDDQHPSLRIAADGLRWFCDPCGEGGDGLRLWMRARRVSFQEAVREIMGEVGVMEVMEEVGCR